MQLAALAAGLLLGGCAGPAAGPKPRPGAGLGGPVVATAERLIGDYAGLSWLEGRAADPVSLAITPQAVSPQAAALELLQRDAGGAERRFRISLETTAIPIRLGGAFEPLGPDGNALGRCALEVTLRADGILARTDPATCRFGVGRDAVGLLKEIAFDGRRLLIVDRVIQQTDAAAPVPDRSLELWRLQRYAGWSGRRDGAADPWRMARKFTIQSDGGVVALVDAADIGLGVELDLGLHRISADGPTVLRLRAFERGSGRLLGQVWADPEATHLGLALDDFQVGLKRIDAPRASDSR